MSDTPMTNAVRDLPATQQVVAALELCAELEAKLQCARPSEKIIEIVKWWDEFSTNYEAAMMASELLRIKEELK